MANYMETICCTKRKPKPTPKLMPPLVCEAQSESCRNRQGAMLWFNFVEGIVGMELLIPVEQPDSS